MTHPRRLQCTCCGSEAIARQWWNQDTGFGLCGPCAVIVATHRPFGHDPMPPEEFRRSYGEAGFHFAIPLIRDLSLGTLVWWKTMDEQVHAGSLKSYDNGTAIVGVHGDEEKAVRV